MHILFAGGGTAGHVNPAIAVAGYIKEHHNDARISYIGTKKGIESRLVPAAGLDFYTIDVEGFQRKISLNNIKRNISAVIKVFTSSNAAKKLLTELKPDIVVGTGGYVSGPVLREAVKLGIKTAIHEQNAFPGVTTKMLASKVDRVMLAMSDAKKHINCKNDVITTGNPIRPQLLNANKELSRAKLVLDERPMILSFGGSLGARPINEAIVGILNYHNSNQKCYHFHATGRAGLQTMTDVLNGKNIDINDGLITVSEYIDNMDVVLAAADLVICRAGAITLAEITACSKPSILIPSPYVAENHQYHNAMSLKNAGAAIVIEEKDLTDERIVEEVKSLISNKIKLEKMSRAAGDMAILDANERIYNVLMKLYTSK